MAARKPPGWISTISIGVLVGVARTASMKSSPMVLSIDTGIALDIESYILNKAGGPGDLIKSVLGRYAPMNPKTIWLRHVVDVQPTNSASLFKAPGLRITTNTEQQRHSAGKEPVAARAAGPWLRCITAF